MRDAFDTRGEDARQFEAVSQRFEGSIQRLQAQNVLDCNFRNRFYRRLAVENCFEFILYCSVDIWNGSDAVLCKSLGVQGKTYKNKTKTYRGHLQGLGLSLVGYRAEFLELSFAQFNAALALPLKQKHAMLNDVYILC